MEYNALYIQLMNRILDKMRRGEYQVGDKMDSERVMAQQYGINRQTVRKALKMLEEEGYIRPLLGKGTFVVKIPENMARIEQSTTATISLSMQIRQSGYESFRKVVSLQLVPVKGILAEKFPDRKMLFELVRLSYVNNEPYALQKAYIPQDLFWDADRYEFGEGSLYEYMDTKGKMPERVESYLQIVTLPKEYTALMKLEEGKKVFGFHYLGYDSTDELVEYTDAYYLPKYTSFKYVAQRG